MIADLTKPIQIKESTYADNMVNSDLKTVLEGILLYVTGDLREAGVLTHFNTYVTIVEDSLYRYSEASMVESEVLQACLDEVSWMLLRIPPSTPELPCHITNVIVNYRGVYLRYDPVTLISNI